MNEKDEEMNINTDNNCLIVDQKMKKQKMVQNEDLISNKFLELIWGRSKIEFDELKRNLGINSDIELINALLDIDGEIYDKTCQETNMKIRFDIDELNKCIYVRENIGSGVIKDIEEIEVIIKELKKRVDNIV